MRFSEPGSKAETEEGERLMPRFGAGRARDLHRDRSPDGRASHGRPHERRGARAHDRDRRGLVLVALRQTLWHKGDTSGQIQSVREMRVDCDQDAIWIKVDVAGDGGCCHTGRRSCFYRSVDLGSESGALVRDAVTTEA